MSSQSDDDVQAAIEATRKRRKEASIAGRKKPRSETISTPTETPKQRAQGSSSKAGKTS